VAVGPDDEQGGGEDGKAISTRMLVTRIFKVKIGIRNMVMPGQRSVITVVITLTAPRMVPSPEMTRPMIHTSVPEPGELMLLFSGAHSVQPASAAPPGVRKPAVARVAPNRYSQYESAFSRGNATSGEPICSGSTRLANANTAGVAKNSSMIVPCIVRSWLYCSGLRNCMPGRASSARISSAITPPIMKNTNDVTRYIRPISL
jgi:hypothetical protein